MQQTGGAKDGYWTLRFEKHDAVAPAPIGRCEFACLCEGGERERVFSQERDPGLPFPTATSCCL